MTGPTYVVDLDLLADSIAELARCGDALDVLLDEVSQRVRALHVTWAGAAALAQEEAQADWEAGFRQMRDALTAMRRAAAVAEGNYGRAAATNLRMWEQIS
jgi:ESAT-6 family protein